jgi:hypothetical protein
MTVGTISPYTKTNIIIIKNKIKKGTKFGGKEVEKRGKYLVKLITQAYL